MNSKFSIMYLIPDPSVTLHFTVTFDQYNLPLNKSTNCFFYLTRYLELAMKFFILHEISQRN